ncbi:MAG: NAD(P)-dependent oxidoreductase [Hydrococcus sp. C42_A2020_068]|uniref:SDR family oxidoreductase n=1 Tax=Pleurocapsa sp. PCC 7327 TaxID=118163 RepID=UPI00029FA815|nr:NAD(P)-dependent oxidoreductase [Pleurocapsa sp. PCC 7327]AFY76534.1 dTDP-4-dehydrorhamnose reductase [Pleurocapsa sp. PCC 7327]MBF2022597.1 NAD(P)-dependent oxidoreductase [Hydrococcus sp. C42_A2020_068]
MQKLLVTGASGFLGWNLCQQARQKWDVWGTYFTHAVEIPGVTLLKVELTDFHALKQLFTDIQPAAVIHTAAQSKPNFCQEHPDETYAINVTSSLNIARLCSDRAIPCVFTSTDLVFNGLNPPYQETDPVSPISYYGEQKVLAERGMLECYPRTAICRMPLMFGVASPVAGSFIQPFIEILKAGKELSLFTDEFRTPVSGSTAASGLLLALEKQIAGLLHLGGKESISRYQFGRLLAEILELPQENIKTCQQKDVPMSAPRSPDTSLDSSKAFALGYQPRSLREELEALKGRI